MYLLSHREGASLTEIALACGFSSSSDFSRSFRTQYGVPPSAFDAEAFRRPRRDEMLASVAPTGEHHLKGLPAGENPDGFAVRLRDLPARRVAYIRVTTPYVGGVPEAIARYDVGLEVPAGTEGDLEVSIAEFSPMRVAEVDIAGGIDLELRALHWLYLTWLPTSGLAPAHQPMFEVWSGRPFAHGSEYFELRAHLAVEDAGVPL